MPSCVDKNTFVRTGKIISKNFTTHLFSPFSPPDFNNDSNAMVDGALHDNLIRIGQLGVFLKLRLLD